MVDSGKYWLIIMANQPDTLQEMTHSELVNVDNPIDARRLKDETAHPRLT